MDDMGFWIAIRRGEFVLLSIAEGKASRETLHGSDIPLAQERLVISTCHSRLQLLGGGTEELHDRFLCRFILTLIKPINDKDMRKGMAARILG